MAQGTPYAKCLQKFFDCLVFEFVSPVCVEQADIFKASFHALEGLFYKLRRFILPRAISYDFPVEEVNKHAYVIPACPHPYIRQVAYHDVPVFPVPELAVQDIFCL